LKNDHPWLVLPAESRAVRKVGLGTVGLVGIMAARVADMATIVAVALKKTSWTGRSPGRS
jgi:Zn-dependent alcohol dehydrogenase